MRGVHTPYIMEQKDRLNIYLPTRLKRRLKAISEDKNIKMNDLVITAVEDMLNRMDSSHSAPDIVLDRMGQMLNSQMAVITLMNEMNQKIQVLQDTIEESET